MEVILKEDINNLGNLGDVVSVKPGYARNYLVPNGKAAFATKENLTSGWINGLGAITNIEIGYYDIEDKVYVKK